jgi:MoxR-like ATPase
VLRSLVVDPRDLVNGWLDGRAGLGPDRALVLRPRPRAPLAERCRAAYAWIATHAILSPYHDLDAGPVITVGDGDGLVELAERSWSSFLLLPLLTLVTSQRLLVVGAPGRGKTTMAVLMGLLAGHGRDEVRRAVQHGHPQLTIADLLGSPLPSELIRAEHGEAIRVAWRRWLSLRVKVVDEYNRIPTKTQSALLSLMAEGYAEMYEQIVECGRSAWFLTANDDLGGGTFPVIEALRDRIDAVVRSTPYHGRFLDELLRRVESGQGPERELPDEILFTPEELDEAEREVRAVELPDEVRDVVGFFAGQLEFCLRASPRLELRNKDTLHLAGRRVAHVCNEDCPLDKQVNLCAQTENGVSARAHQSLLLYAKAFAWFRGDRRVTLSDVRQLLPWVLFDKLKPNPQGAFFQKAENQVLLGDRATWIQRLFDAAVVQHAAWQAVRGPVRKLVAEAEAEPGMAALSAAELRQRAQRVQKTLAELVKKHEMNGPVYEDVVLLKDLHARYQLRLDAVERAGGANGARSGR